MADIKRLRLRLADTCACGVVLEKGAQAGWDRAARQVLCLSCVDARAEAPLVEAGTPGGSLLREHARRHAARERRVRAMFPRVGGLLLAMIPDPDTTKAFATGAKGEQELASKLGQMCPNVLFLHNRRLSINERFGEIDHIAVAPSGVFIIDAQNYQDAKVKISPAGFLSGGAEKLIIRGRNRTHLVDRLKKQQAGVEQALARRSQLVPVPVRAMFCFRDAELPWGENQSINGLLIRGGRRTAKILNTPGNLTPERRRDIWTHLAKMLPSA